MAWLVLGLGLLVAFVVFLRWFATAEPGDVWRVLKWIGLGLAIVVGLVILLRGGLQFLWVAAAFLIPWLLRMRGLRNWASAARPRAGGQRSTVRTSFVVMELDHDTGEMDGEILKGRYMHRRLSEMELDDIIELLHLASREDPQSAQLLRTYLDRMHGDEWRERAGAGDGSGEGAGEEGPRRQASRMSREEAYEVLGLEPEASDEDIKAAHRRLIRVYHPDHGGSDYLAATINEAKDVLLDE